MRSDADTVIVAARDAWPEYLRVQAYVCQPDRAFKRVGSGSVQYLGFYSNNQIYRAVARILEPPQTVTFERRRYPGRLGEVVEELLASSPRKESARYEVFLLSPREAADTADLGHTIENDLRSATGRRYAFARAQRYVRLEDLKKAKYTSELGS